MQKARITIIVAGLLFLPAISAYTKSLPSAFINKGKLEKDIRDGKSVMFICPHPEDEVFIAGTIAFVAGEKETFFYICCLGSMENLRRENIDVPSRLKAIRWLTKRYLRDYIFLENNFTAITPKVINAIKPKLIEAIENNNPAIIITFSHFGYDGDQNRRLTSKIVTDILPSLGYRPELYFLINTDQELNYKFKEYRKFPSTDSIDLNSHSKKLGKTLWEAKLEIWDKYSDSVPSIMGVIARKKRLESNDHKEYFRLYR